ncbi:MAG: anthranilate phosphoribosyltransferase [Verrucomicrobia bacterium]|nr:anthranilate phosphoribosyltransferase [Verrucomicrobiota bacterium]
MSCERTVPEALARATQHCRARREMRVQEAEDLVAGLADPGVADAAKVEFLLAWAEKGETAGELAGLARAFLARARPAGLSGRWGGHPLADTCGTGGGGRSIVNISTAAAVVAAAAGIPVAKHGNRGVTRPSGSADALTVLGVAAAKDAGELADCLGQVGCSFLLAPNFHPAFAGVAGARKIMAAQGKRTGFHLLGPLVNPARPEVRMIGVFREEDAEKLAGALASLGCDSYAVVFGEDEKGAPLGELSPLGRNRLVGALRGKAFDVTEARSPAARGHSGDLEAGDAKESATKITEVLEGGGLPAVHDAVVWNAGVILWLAGVAKDLAEGRKKAEETIRKGAARALLERWKTWSRGKFV